MKAQYILTGHHLEISLLECPNVLFHLHKHSPLTNIHQAPPKVLYRLSDFSKLQISNRVEQTSFTSINETYIYG